ncbi:hypothetical protein N566_23330 [Streptomycetaceae bacterium MP113-05]|nr:hypothetical protein N566_23330 [Streptomycetaceae bacterium MP113-05]
MAACVRYRVQAQRAEERRREHERRAEAEREARLPKCAECGGRFSEERFAQLASEVGREDPYPELCHNCRAEHRQVEHAAEFQRTMQQHLAEWTAAHNPGDARWAEHEEKRSFYDRLADRLSPWYDIRRGL